MRKLNLFIIFLICTIDTNIIAQEREYIVRNDNDTIYGKVTRHKSFLNPTKYKFKIEDGNKKKHIIEPFNVKFIRSIKGIDGNSHIITHNNDSYLKIIIDGRIKLYQLIDYAIFFVSKDDSDIILTDIGWFFSAKKSHSEIRPLFEDNPEILEEFDLLKGSEKNIRYIIEKYNKFMLKNLFKRKPKISVDNNKTGDSTTISKELIEKINKSTLPLLTHKLFMHYFDKNTIADEDNPAWRNQGIFFWSAKEPFKRKSLPPEFLNFEERFFIFNELPNDYDFFSAKAAPWFGMPGLGDKNYLERGKSKMSLERLLNQNVIEYIEVVQLDENNTSILENRDYYRILLDDEDMRYESETDKFFFKDIETTLGDAFNLGGIKIVKIKETIANN